MRVGIFAYPVVAPSGVFKWINTSTTSFKAIGVDPIVLIGSRPRPDAWRSWGWRDGARLHQFRSQGRWPARRDAVAFSEWASEWSVEAVVTVAPFAAVVAALSSRLGLFQGRVIVSIRAHLPRTPKGFAYMRALGALAPHIDALAPVSTHLLEAMPHRLSSRPSHVLPNVVTAPPLAELALDREGFPEYVFLGRLEPEKNVDGFLRFASRVPEARCAIYGNGREINRVEEACQRLSNVTYFGWGNPDDVLAKYQYLLQPSLAEGWPNVVAEAMASGCLPLTSKAKAFRNIGVPAELQFDSPDHAVELAAQIAAWPERKRTRLRVDLWNHIRAVAGRDAQVEALRALLRPESSDEPFT
jgi:glycosyltransferase involved in cell wall biosynthesis